MKRTEWLCSICGSYNLRRFDDCRYCNRGRKVNHAYAVKEKEVFERSKVRLSLEIRQIGSEIFSMFADMILCNRHLMKALDSKDPNTTMLWQVKGVDFGQLIDYEVLYQKQKHLETQLFGVLYSEELMANERFRRPHNLGVDKPAV